MAGKVVVGYLDDERGPDALALGRILARARDAELGIVTVEAGNELASAVREVGADLVVLGATHRGSVGQMAHAATMRGVLARTGAAVAVAPRGFASRAEGTSDWQPLDGDTEDVGMRVIGVGFDGTPESRHALGLATELALRNGATLRVYSVCRKTIPIASGAPMTPVPAATNELEWRRAQLQETVAALPSEVRPQPVLLKGFAADELIAASRLGVDLIVVGTHVGGHLHRLVHKSVAGLVAEGAHCPVLICPTSVAEPTPALATA
jgi:nucleotide-binding universal stress UspA family protein